MQSNQRYIHNTDTTFQRIHKLASKLASSCLKKVLGISDISSRAIYICLRVYDTQKEKSNTLVPAATKPSHTVLCIQLFYMGILFWGCHKLVVNENMCMRT